MPVSFSFYIFLHHHHQSILPKGRSFIEKSGTKHAVVLKGRSSTANSGTQAAVLLGMDRCGSFPLLSAPHSLFSIWTDLKRSEKIPEAPVWRREEWIWITRPSGLHRNSPQGVKYQFQQFLTRWVIRKSQSLFVPNLNISSSNYTNLTRDT